MEFGCGIGKEIEVTIEDETETKVIESYTVYRSGFTPEVELYFHDNTRVTITSETFKELFDNESE